MAACTEFLDVEADGGVSLRLDTTQFDCTAHSNGVGDKGTIVD